MRTNIDLDENLLREAFRFSRATTKKELVHEALRVYVELKGRKDLRDLRGKISFRTGYDYKTMRKGA